MSRDTDKSIERVEGAISDLISEIEELEGTVEKLEKEVVDLQKSNDNLQDEIDEINIIATNFENDASFWRNKYEELNKHNNYETY